MISKFHGKYRWLSNFWSSPVILDEVMYPSVEHAYQAAKTQDLPQRSSFFTCTPAEAKRMGQRVTLRPDWEEIKISVMEALLRQKFCDARTGLGRQLVDTGDQELIEGNTWGDRFWGVDGSGRNILGKLLMRIRDDLTRHPPVC